MKKRNWIAAMLLLFSLSFAAGCSPDGKQNQAEDKNTAGTVTDTEENDESEQEADTQQVYQVEMVSYQKTDRIDISYPQITGWSDEQAQQEWNTLFLQIVKQAAGEWTEDTVFDTQETGLREQDVVRVSFTVQEQNAEILSLTCESYYEYEGAAHPSKALTSYTINMKTGEKITFSDLADVDETAERLFAVMDEETAENGCTVLDAEGNPSTEITVRDILEYNFIWMEPSADALASSFSHFDGEMEDYGEDETMGASYVHDGSVYLIFYVSHAMGDYVVVRLD